MALHGVAAIVASLDWTGALSNRVVAVLVGYFDDSGTDADSPVAVMAGYVAPAAQWNLFERKTKRLFDREKIPFFRAKLFDHGEKQFKGWGEARKLRFATEWFSYAEEHVLRGASGAVLKDDHKAVKKAHRSASSISEQSTCMSIALALLCKDGAVWSEIERNRLSLVIEKSGSDDGGVRYGIERLAVANEFLSSALDTVTFADKERVRALQLADYLAYYSFQLALSARHHNEEGATEFLNIALRAVTTHKNMGGDFVPSRDFATAMARAKRKRKEARREGG